MFVVHLGMMLEVRPEVMEENGFKNGQQVTAEQVLEIMRRHLAMLDAEIAKDDGRQA